MSRSRGNGAVLVTGGAGFIGSHIAARLVDEGRDVWIVDDLSTGSAQNLPRGARFLQLDLARSDAADRLPREPFDAVLHLAGQSSGEKSHDDPIADVEANLKGTIHLLRWCRDRGIGRFLYASSMAVYGNPDRQPMREDHPCRPCSFYGINKLTAEHYLRLFEADGLESTVFRMFSVYGPGQDLANLKQGMVSIYLAYLLDGRPITVKGSLDRFRDFIYIDDVVTAWLTALGDRTSIGKTYNLGTGRRTSVQALLDALLRAAGRDPAVYPIDAIAPTPGDQSGVVADVSALRSDLGWSPAISLEDGLRRMVASAMRAAPSPVRTA